MAPVGALLQRALRVHQVYGANTDVGKTILTTILCNSAARNWKSDQVSYLKPVSTGALDDADEGCMCQSACQAVNGLELIMRRCCILTSFKTRPAIDTTQSHSTICAQHQGRDIVSV